MADLPIPIDDEDTGSVASLTPVLAQRGSLVRPAAGLDEIRQAFIDYTTLCDQLLVASDFQRIGDKDFRKKSAWRKLAVAFGVSVVLVERRYEREGRHIVRAEIVCRATAPNGRTFDGLGACDAFERCCEPNCKKRRWNNHTCCPADCTGFVHFSKPNHDIPATAMTRASNRACADLFGMGEVSAEEITDHDQPPDGPQRGRQREGAGQTATRVSQTRNDSQSDLPEGWPDWPACDAGHAAVIGQIKSALDAIPEDQRAAVRKPWDEHKASYGWPMHADALAELSRMVAKATKPAEPAQEPEAASGEPTPTPEAPEGHHGPEKGQSGPAAAARTCPWCEKSIFGNAALVAGKPDREGNKRTWHKACFDEWEKEGWQ